MARITTLGSAAFLATAICLSTPGQANGLGGNSSPSRIPVPTRDFQAVVEDQTGVRVEVTEVSYNGEIFLYGSLGEGQVTVPFERLAEVRFEPTTNPSKLAALATLVDGQHVRLLVDNDVRCFGSTTFGNYSIESSKVRKIEFKTAAPEEPVKPPEP